MIGTVDECIIDKALTELVGICKNPRPERMTRNPETMGRNVRNADNAPTIAIVVSWHARIRFNDQCSRVVWYPVELAPCPSICAGDSGNSDSSNAPSPCVLFSCQGPLRQMKSLGKVMQSNRRRSLSPWRPAMTSNESKNEMLVMVLTDLVGICKKLAENSAVPESLRVKARELGEEFDSLSPLPWQRHRNSACSRRDAVSENSAIFAELT